MCAVRAEHTYPLCPQRSPYKLGIIGHSVVMGRTARAGHATPEQLGHLCPVKSLEGFGGGRLLEVPLHQLLLLKVGILRPYTGA